ncbi:MAG: membrane protein insertion efficiency factor YidD [Leadbetterella sp.]
MKFIVIVFLLNYSISNAQYAKFVNVIDKGPSKKEYKEAKGNNNEIESLFSGMFLLYKSFFSSQDLSVCTFTPSCSEYGIQSVKKYGIIKGGIMTMDRLTRCNGLSNKNYEIDVNQHLLIDKPGFKPEVTLFSHEH